MKTIIELLQNATTPTTKEWIKENWRGLLLSIFDYMKRSDFLKPIEEWDTLDAYIKHIAKEEDSIQAFINLIK